MKFKKKVGKILIYLYLLFNPLMELVLIRTVFYLCENAQNSHNFCSISVLFFSLKDNIRGHLHMKIFLADFVPYNITADADGQFRAYT
jgi:hypothetical protein